MICLSFVSLMVDISWNYTNEGALKIDVKGSRSIYNILKTLWSDYSLHVSHFVYINTFYSVFKITLLAARINRLKETRDYRKYISIRMMVHVIETYCRLKFKDNNINMEYADNKAFMSSMERRQFTKENIL